VRVRTESGDEVFGTYEGTETHPDEASGEPTVMLFVDDSGRLVGVPLPSVTSVDIIERFDAAQDVLREMASILTQQRTIEEPLWRTVSTGTHGYLEVNVTPHSLACEDR
jgi:hypothetical protein